MVSVLEAPTDKLIEKVAEKLKTEEAIKVPAWLTFVKSGAHSERKPQSKNFWFLRCASILRKAYLEGNIGVGRLRVWYGRRKCYGTSPEHHVDAGGKIIREAMKQLEGAGLLKKEKVGRSITPKGKSLLDKIAMEFYAGERHGRDRSGVIGKTAAASKTPRPRKRATKRASASKPSGAEGKGKAGEHTGGEPDPSAKD